MTFDKFQTSNKCSTKEKDPFETELQVMFKDLEQDYNGLDQVLYKIKEVKQGYD